MTSRDEVLDSARLAGALETLPGWRLDDGWLQRVYQTDGWPTTLMLVNAIGFVAESADHHPELSISWGRLTVRLQTHSAGGVTAKDVELARVIEDTALWRPSGGTLAPGTRAAFVRSGSAQK